MKKINITLLLVAGALLANNAVADGLSWQLTAGLATNHFSDNTQNIWLNDSVENSYSVNATPVSVRPFVGAGFAYTWNHKLIDLSLGLSTYYLKSTATGINTPFINDGPDYDTLNYQAAGQSYALMLEPKIAYTAYSLQPYVLAGAGVAFNHFSAYTETPTHSGGSAAATNTPFSDKRSTNFAYEVGVGVQYHISVAYAPTIAVDYRYMNWGNAGVGQFAGQTTSNTLNFGKLSTGITSISLLWPF